MYHIRSFEKFIDKDIDEKIDKKSEYIDYLKQSQDYIEYVADFINNGSVSNFGTSGSAGSSGDYGSSAHQGNSTSSGNRYIGKSRINGENLYLDSNNVPFKEEDKKPLETIHKKSEWSNGEWSNGEWSNLNSKPKDNFGDWTKNNSKKLPLYEKWMIGIGIGSLIIGIITVVIMIVAK